jgi:hypothetical protein
MKLTDLTVSRTVKASPEEVFAPAASANSTWRFPTTDAAWAPPGLRLRTVSSWPSVVGSA